MANTFWSAYAWQDDSKTNLLTTKPINKFQRVFRHMELNQPYEYELTAMLTDKVAGNIGKGTYVEIWAGKTTSPVTSYPPGNGQSLWLSGYVDSITQSVDRSNQYELVLYSASYQLSHRRNKGALEMDYPNYRDMIDAMNGRGSTTGKLGILTGTNFTANFLPQAGSHVPGAGDSWRTDWETVLTNVSTMAHLYGLQWRERPGSTSSSGVIDMGKMGDDSGITIYGGDPLATALGLPAHARPNAQQAQQAGYTVISAASYNEDLSTIYNICWPLGAGTGETLVTISGSTGFQGPPLNKNGAVQYGWAQWIPTPGGRTFYTQNSNKQTFDNQTFALIAEQMNDGSWAYGVVDLSSVQGDQNNPAYGLREYVATYKKQKDPNALLSAALGVLVTNRQMVASWTFGVAPPLSGNGVPAAPLPGQSVTVNYAGAVHQSIDFDFTPGSATYGQYVGIGDYTYLQFPNTTDPGLISKAKKVVTMEDEWSGKQYSQTLTLGKIAPNTKATENDLAADFEDHRHKTGKRYTFTKHPLDQIPFIFSQNPDAWEDPTQSGVTLSQGSFIVSNVPHERFFDDHHSVEYTVTVNDPGQAFNFWFAKPIDGTLTNPVASRAYPMFRLMFQGGTIGTGQKRGCGFFLNNTNNTGTPVGDLVNKRMFDGKGRLRHTGTYRVRLTWSGNKYEAHIARQENGDNVWAHDLAAIWHDTAGQAGTYGAIGWHLTGSGASNAQLGSLHLHPITLPSRTHQGGSGKRHTKIHEKDGGGTEHVSYDAAASSFVRHFRSHTTGHTHAKNAHTHGPFHTSTGTVGLVSGTNPVTVTFTGVLPEKGALKAGWIASDNAGNFCFVQTVNTNKAGKITSFTTTDTSASNFLVNSLLSWDALEPDGEPQQGHKRFGVYNPPITPNDPKGGWAIADRAADAPQDGSADVVYLPDGSMRKGDKPITQGNGAVVNVQELIIGGSHLAKGLEKEGAVLFDAGEYDSTSQIVNCYPVGTGPANPVVTPNTAGFYGGNPSTIEASWVDTTQDSAKVTGQADSILQLSAGTFGGNTYNTIQWQDQQILTEEKDGNGNQVAKSYTVKKDVTFSFPIYIGVQQSASTLKLGCITTFVSYDSSTKKLAVTMDAGSLSAIGSGDLFVINPGGSNQETVTVSSVDTTNVALVLTANPVNTHVAGEILAQKSSGGVAVQSGGLLDGTTSFSQVISAIDVIAVGFWGYTKDGSGNKTFNWYRGWWGDPVFGTICPYGTGLNYLGKLPGNNLTDWLDLHCKAQQLGLHWGTTRSTPPVTIVGCELAIYSASPGTGVTVYFDAHSQGHASHKNKTAAGSVHSHHMRGKSHKAKHKLPTHHADSHHHSDFTFWCDPSNVVHWESGTLVMHDGTKYTINGAPEDTPNAGLTGAHAGDYLVFNTSGTAISLADPTYGTVSVPAYSAAGGTGGQTNGFALLSDTYPFHKRKTGATVKTGLPDELVKIGKVAYQLDTYTGELPVHTHHGSGKKHAKHHRKGSHARKHGVKHHHHGRHHYHNLLFKITGAS